MTTLRLTGVQLRYVNKAFWRNPASAFFTFAFPLMFLVIFTALLGHFTVQLGSRTVNTSTYYVASMASFSVITACFNNIAAAVTFQREDGNTQAGARHPAAKRVLHRRQDPARDTGGGPARGDHRRVRPPRVQRRHSHRAEPAAVRRRAAWPARPRSAPSGSRSLRSSRTLTRRPRSSTPSSSRRVPVRHLHPFGNNTPAWILWVAKVFPVRPLRAEHGGRLPRYPAFNWTDVLVVAAWGIAGMLLAIRFFTWEPRQG